MQEQETIINGFFTRHPELDRSKYSFRLTNSKNILVYRTDDLNINYLLHKTTGKEMQINLTQILPGGSAVQSDDVSKLDCVKNVIDFLKAHYPDFSEDDYNIRVTKKKKLVWLERKNDNTRRFVIESATSKIEEWDNGFQKPSFSDSLIKSIESNIRQEILNRNLNDLIRDVICKQDEDALTIRFVPLDKKLFLENKIVVKRTYLNDSEEAKYFSFYRPDMFQPNAKFQKELCQTLTSFYKEKMKLFGGQKKFREFANSNVGRLFFPNIKKGWLYKGTIPDSSNIASSDLHDKTRYVFLIGNYMLTYNYLKKTIRKGPGDSSEADKYNKVYLMRKKLSKITEIVLKDYPEAKFNYLSSQKICAVIVKGFSELRLDLQEDGCVDNAKEWVKIIKAKEKEREEKETARIRKLPHFGNIVAIAAVNLIIANNRYITPAIATKMLRGNALQSSFSYSKTSDCGKFGELPAAMIEEILNNLVKAGVLNLRIAKGAYGRYEVIHPGKDAGAFVKASKEISQEAKTFEGLTEVEVLEVLRKGKASKAPAGIGKNFIYLSDHPGIWCEAKTEIEEYSKGLTEKYREYIRTMAEFEEMPALKSYKKKLSNLGKTPRRNSDAE